MQELLLLEDAPQDWSGSTCVQSVSAWHSRAVEAAGYAFHEYSLLRLGLKDCQTDGQLGDDEGVSDQAEDEKLRAAWEERKRAQNSLDGEETEEENLYEILGIGHIGFSASLDQLKKAYQKSILIHHPDKLSAEERDKVEQQQKEGKVEHMFLKVQRAWETLSDPVRRRGYDSQFAFDDSIPDGGPLDSDQEFYEEYGPVFERNARFSVKKPVPGLGDDSTPISRVQKFYSFWNLFESWRDFSKFDEFKNGDIDNAQSRMEKRWMIRQNEIQQNKRKKKEYERIKLLVARASELDPRLRRMREAEQRAKEQAYQERKAKEEEERRLKEEAEERRRKEEEERERIRKETEERERKERQAVKKEFKRQIRYLKKCCDAAVELVGYSTEQKEELGRGIIMLSDWFQESEQVRHLVEAFADGQEMGSEGFCEPKDVSIAQKGLDIVLEMIAKIRDERDSLEAKKEEERQQKLKEEQRMQEKAKAESSQSWTADELSFLAKAIRKFPPGSRNRWVMVSNFVNTLPDISTPRSPEDCIAQSKLLATNVDVRKQIGTSKAAFEMHQKKLNKVSSTSSAPTDTSAPPPDAPDSTSDWTSEQQEALEKALKEFPASMEKNERWKAIAKAVPGKSKKDCVARFKYLRQMLLEKKNTASS